MSKLKLMLTTNWHLMRVLRIVFGSFFLVQAFMTSEAIVGLAGLLFLYQGVTNTGCCGASCMNIPEATTDKAKKEIDYEEVK